MRRMSVKRKRFLEWRKQRLRPILYKIRGRPLSVYDLASLQHDLEEEAPLPRPSHQR
jgi:hypothetical protein